MAGEEYTGFFKDSLLIGLWLWRPLFRERQLHGPAYVFEGGPATTGRHCPDGEVVFLDDGSDRSTSLSGRYSPSGVAYPLTVRFNRCELSLSMLFRSPITRGLQNSQISPPARAFAVISGRSAGSPIVMATMDCPVEFSFQEVSLCSCRPRR